MRPLNLFWWILGGELLGFVAFMLGPSIHGRRAAAASSEPDEVRAAVRRAAIRYRLTLTGLLIASVAAIYLVLMRWHSVPGALLIGGGFNLAALFGYLGYARRVRPYVVAEPVTRYAVSLQNRRLADYTHGLIEAFIVILTLAPLGLLIAAYGSMPDPLPVHWNAAGEPERWVRKNLGVTFFIPALAVYLQSILLLVKYDVIHSRLILPAEPTAEILRYKDQYLNTNVRLMDWLRVPLASQLAGIALLPLRQQWEAAVPIFSAIAMILIWSGLAVLIGGICYFCWRLWRIKSELESLSPRANAPRSIDEPDWQHGGLTYSNPEDSAVVVEKLVGLGFTYNLASRGAHWRLATLAGVPLLLVWAFFSLR
ncbi:MAG TPA: DUF1648 domain-containing protein [Blastocatellia bacterium]|nr:DUF1648 domain-containing protein [Blastocatellia bacterium]